MRRCLLGLIAVTILAMPAPLLATPGDPTWVRTFDNDFYNWATPHVASFPLPGTATHWQKILLFYRIGCPPTPADCDPWDRIGHLRVLHDTGQRDSTGAPVLEPFEIARIITPYDITGGLRPGTCTWVLDVSDYKTLLHDSVTLESYIESWIGGIRGWLVTVDFAFIEGEPALEPYRVINLWNNYYNVYGDPARPIEDNLPPISVPIDGVTVGAKLRVTTTAHGQGNTDGCAEFCAKQHTVIANGMSFSHVLWRSDCNHNPCSPQGGTWSAARAGWCPGDAVTPWDVDVTASITPGGTATLDYNIQPYVNFCRPDNPACVSGTTCINCQYDGGGHTEPHYSIQSQLILYAAAGTAAVEADPGDQHNIGDPDDLSGAIALSQNEPNPFANGTTIRYTLAMEQDVTLLIYNPGGRLVRELRMGRQSAGSHEYFWDGLNDTGQRVTSGVYYYELKGENASATRTMIHLH